METIEIKKTNVQKAYQEAGDNQAMRNVLKALFGEGVEQELQVTPTDVRERIKTFEDAYRELGSEHMFCKAWDSCYQGVDYDFSLDSDIADLIAYKKLKIICAALNEGWEPQFTEDEYRYYPWFYLYTQSELDEMDEDERTKRNMLDITNYQAEYAGLGCSTTANAPSTASANFGSRLCLANHDLALYCGKQFIDLWADFYLIRKTTNS